MERIEELAIRYSEVVISVLKDSGRCEHDHRVVLGFLINACAWVYIIGREAELLYGHPSLENSAVEIFFKKIFTLVRDQVPAEHFAKTELWDLAEYLNPNDGI